MEREEALKKAYEWGKEVGKSVAETAKTIPEITSPEEAYANYEEGEVQSADYANAVLPELRRLAGCKDIGGVGTYTVCSDEQIDLYHELIDKYWEGVYDGIIENWEKKP